MTLVSEKGQYLARSCSRTCTYFRAKIAPMLRQCQGQALLGTCHRAGDASILETWCMSNLVDQAILLILFNTMQNFTTSKG